MKQFYNYFSQYKKVGKMIQLFTYLYETFSQQFYDEVTILKEITEYYTDSFHENMIFKNKIRQIDNKLSKATTYQQWKSIAQQHDQLPQIREQMNKVYSPYYDYSYIQELQHQLASARKHDKIDKLISILRSHSYRNIGNITSQLLYRDGYNSTYKLIEDFQQQVIKCLRKILNSSIGDFRKLQFFGQLRHAVGRSALLLSGGAILGMYHIGVVQTLIQANCMPKIIAGSSAGSMIAAFIATKSRQQFFDGNTMNFTAFINKKKYSLWRKLRRIAKQGYVMDIKVLQNFLKDNVGEITFQQAFDKYGWILNITVTGSSQHDEDRLLNYLTAPNVLIWSACAASCAIPFIYGATTLFCKDLNGSTRPYTLMNRKFLDGSISNDLPMNKLSVFFNVNNFIVSQTNPWVIPFMDYTEQFKKTSNPVIIRFLIIGQQLKQFILSQIKHRANQLSFLFPSAITKFFNLFTQSYVGNITIWPVPSLSNYLRIMENPTDFNMILNFVEDGKKRTYPKIRQIKSSLFFENEINNCFKATKRVSRLRVVQLKQNSEIDEEDFNWKFDQADEKTEKQKSKNHVKQQINTKMRNSSFVIPRQRSRNENF